MHNAKKYLVMFVALGLAACGGAGQSASSDSGSMKLVLAGLSGPAAAASSAKALTRSAAMEEPCIPGLGVVCPVNIDYRDFVFKVSVEADCGSGYDKTVRFMYVPWDPVEDGRPVQLFNALPLTSCTFTAKGYSILGTLLFEGSTAATVQKNTVGNVLITMIQKVQGTTVNVTAPNIDAIVVSDGAPSYGEKVHLSASLPERVKRVGTFLWETTCIGKDGEVPADRATQLLSLSSPTGTETDLVSYCEGKTYVTFSVTDPTCPYGASMTSSVSFGITFSPQGEKVAVLWNTMPNILGLKAGPNAMPIPGGSVDLTATVSDPDLDPLTFAWTARCDGQDVAGFDDASLKNPKFTVPASTPEQSQCVLTLKVDDGLQSNTATLTLFVGPGYLIAVPYIDVCNPATWACTQVNAYADASSTIDADGLHLVKTAADTAAAAFGPNAHITGIQGQPFQGASFDAVGTIVAGSPRFYAVFEDSSTCQLDAPAVTGSHFVFAPTACTAGKTIKELDLIADMGGQAGSLVVSNIKVNDAPVLQ